VERCRKLKSLIIFFAIVPLPPPANDAGVGVGAFVGLEGAGQERCDAHSTGIHIHRTHTHRIHGYPRLAASNVPGGPMMSAVSFLIPAAAMVVAVPTTSLLACV
jgi:hypothetical protein